MILKSKDIDWNLLTMGDEEGDYSMNAEAFEVYAKCIQEEGGRLVSVYDAEGERVCIAPAKVAAWLTERLNLVKDIEDLVAQHPDAFLDTPAGDSTIGGKRWPPAGNNQRTSPLERVLAVLQKHVEGK